MTPDEKTKISAVISIIVVMIFAVVIRKVVCSPPTYMYAYYSSCISTRHSKKNTGPAEPNNSIRKLKKHIWYQRLYASFDFRPIFETKRRSQREPPKQGNSMYAHEQTVPPSQKDTCMPECSFFSPPKGGTLSPGDRCRSRTPPGPDPADVSRATL